MKSQVLSKFAVFTLALASAFSLSAFAQTTDQGPGPSEQPSAPMEVGTPQAPEAPPSVAPDTQPSADQPGANAPAEAQPGGPSGEAPAKTDLGVARISMIHGDVSTQRGDSGDWSAATLNQPVMGGDRVSTGDNARTELQFDFANILRLGGNSKANIATLTHKNIQIQLSQGIANYSVSKESEAEPEIDTPNVSVHPAHQDGVFRIEVRPDGDTLIIVRKGEAQISTPQGSTEVHVGEMATVRGDTNSAQYKISQAPDPDDWDRWNADRDHMIRNAESWRHTNHYYTGAEDLDAYGRWQNVPDYGNVWVPNEPDGWAPYRNGNWTYEPYYGWTWVGYEPWGWAPYHYGRWFWYGNSWAWWPGPAYGWYRPFWSPAYVSFWGLGWGFGVGFGWGWGGFGWLPIGPGDWFHPWWGGYGGRFGVFGAGFGGYGRFGGFAPLRAGRFSNIANIHNDHVFRGMSTVGAGHFGAGHFGATGVTHEQFNGARMMAGNLPVVPSHASLSASGRAAAPSTVRNGGSERFFGSTHNNVARPASFSQQTAHLQQSMAQNHVNGFTAGSRESASFNSRGTTSAATAGKPSAGTPARGGETSRGGETAARGGETNNNLSNRSFGNNGTANNHTETGANRTENRSFSSPGSSPSNNLSRPSGVESQRGTSQSSSTNRDGFRSFAPPSNSGASRGESGASSERGGSGSYWNRTTPSSTQSRGMNSNSMESRGTNSTGSRSYGSESRSYGSESRGYGSGAYGSGAYGRSGGSYSRPQLDMHQPIVRGPSYGGGYGGSRPSYGGSRGATPSYGGSRGGYSGGGHANAPSGGRSFGGGGRSSGGGGHSSGGGHSGGGGHGGHR